MYRKFGVERDIEWKIFKIAPPLTFDVTIFDHKHIAVRFLAVPKMREHHVSLIVDDDPLVARALRDCYVERLGTGSDLHPP